MININFTNIHNAKMIGRLLPFWARGKTISLLLQALLSPIRTVYEQFQYWALERYIECHITAQKASLEWYLKYKLHSHFQNENDVFFIANGLNGTVSCFSGAIWRNGLHWANDLKWDSGVEPQNNLNSNLTCINTGVWDNSISWNNAFFWVNDLDGKLFDDDYLEAPNQTRVYAPAIVDTVVYNHEDYERDIRNIMSKFMINFNRIVILVAEAK